MTWWAIDVRPPAAERAAVGAWLVARTGQAIEERDDGSLVTFAGDEHEADDIMHELGRRPGGAVAASRRPLELVDWSTRWRDGLGAHHFGRLTVTPRPIPDSPWCSIPRWRSGAASTARPARRSRCSSVIFRPVTG